jgi:5-hydroxyisourate hydrolase
MSGITTHVLDTSRGRPAAGVEVTLERLLDGAWRVVNTGRTNDDGRLHALAADQTVVPGTYRLFFDTGKYFESVGASAFYPHVTIVFAAASAEEHYHVPLLLSPYGYSTYRGS